MKLLLKRTKDAYTNGKEIFCDHRGKMEISTYLSIITLSINGLDALIKRHKVEDWIKRQQKVLNDTIDQLDLIDNLSTRHPKNPEYIPFKGTENIL